MVSSVVCKLLLNYITRPHVPFNRASYSIFYDGSQNSVLKRVGSTAGMVLNIVFYLWTFEVKRTLSYCSKLEITDGFFFLAFPFLHSANIVLLPFSYLISSSSEGSRSPIADSSLHVLLVLIQYHKCLVCEGYSVIENDVSASSNSLPKENTYFSDNPYCKALERATDCECNIAFISLCSF